MLNRKKDNLQQPKNIDDIFKGAMIVGNFKGAGIITQDFIPPGGKRDRPTCPPDQKKMEKSTAAKESPKLESPTSPATKAPTSPPSRQPQQQQHSNTAKSTSPSQQSSEPSFIDASLPLNMSAPAPASPQSSQIQQNLDIDGLKIPDVGTQDPSGSLDDFSVTSDSSEFDGTSTVELDIRSTALYKQKQQGHRQVINERLAAKARELSLLEGIFILKHALGFDFIEEKDAKNILTECFENRAQGENPVSIMVRDGYITTFQYQTLSENLAKDKDAGRLQRQIDISTLTKAATFLGLGGLKKIVLIKCPHCRAGFRVRINVKGGKFKCGKCQKYFFLRGSK